MLSARFIKCDVGAPGLVQNSAANDPMADMFIREDCFSVASLGVAPMELEGAPKTFPGGGG